MTALVNEQWFPYPGDPATKSRGFRKEGSTSNHVAPTAYVGLGGEFKQTPTLPNGVRQPIVTVPNLTPVHNLVVSGINLVPYARNKAYDGFLNQVRSGPASVAVTLAEWRSSVAMIGSRTTQLYRGYRALRRGKFRQFLRIFGMEPKRSHRKLRRNRVKDASDLWLEYSFGWSPLLGDIYNAANAMSQPVPAGRCSGRGIERNDFYQDPSVSSFTQQLYGRVRVRLVADVYVTNPNLYLLQHVGLANPFLVAWEIIPWSFMVDWVFDVSTFLGSFTDFLGCTLQNTNYVAFGTWNGTATWRWVDGRRFTNSGRAWAVRRNTGLYRPMPNVSWRANIGSSLKRAANAASLLGQMMARH